MRTAEKYCLPRKTIVFLGMSGVGKSSLLNVLMEREVMVVKTIREDDSRGRHTTTHRQLFMLPSGAMVIDTPGMRHIGMWNAEEGHSETFADVESLLGTCRFSDCRHETEPGCTIREAVESGELLEERYRNYVSLLKESAYAERKASYLRIKRERNKAIAMWSKAQKSTKTDEFDWR